MSVPFVQLRSSCFLFDDFVYVDTLNADSAITLAKHNILPRIKRVMQRKDNQYVAVLCRVPKWKTNRFIEAMMELNRDMILRGIVDYPKYVDDFYETISASVEVKNQRAYRK